MARAVQGRFSALTRAHELARPGLVDHTGKFYYDTSLRTLTAAIFEPYAKDHSEVPPRFIFAGTDLVISKQAITNVALYCALLMADVELWVSDQVSLDGRIIAVE
jgi:hypothetical protein